MAICEQVDDLLPYPPNARVNYTAAGLEATLTFLCLAAMYSSRSYILKIYWRFISFIVLAQICSTFTLVIHYKIIRLDSSILGAFVFSIGYLSLMSFVESLCVIFLVQRSSGRAALNRSRNFAVVIFLFDIITRGFSWLQPVVSNYKIWICLVNYSCHIAFYICIIVFMYVTNYAHHAWTKYFVYVLLVDDIVILLAVILVLWTNEGYCLITLRMWLGVLIPVVLCYALWCDSNYWRSFCRSFVLKPRKSIYRATRSSSFLGFRDDSLSEDRKYKRIDDFLSTQVKVLDPARLKIGAKIGRGSSASIYMGTLRSGSGGFFHRLGGGSGQDAATSTKVAVKEIIMDELTPQIVGDFLKEALICSQFNHPGITKLIGVVVAPPAIRMVLEYCNLGSLTQVLLDYSIDLSWLERVTILQHISEAMAHMHTCHVLHRDLKSDNIICHHTPTGEILPKICDFGLARELTRHRAYSKVTESEDVATSMNPQNFMTTLIGTVKFLPPEVLGNIDFSVFIPYANQEYTQYTKPLDVFAFGCIMHECVSRDVIWKDYRINEIVDAVLAGELPSLGPHAHNCPKTLHELKVRCLASNPEGRPTFAQITNILSYLREEIEQSDVEHYRKDKEPSKRLFSVFSSLRSKSSADSGNFFKLGRRAKEYSKLRMEKNDYGAIRK